MRAARRPRAQAPPAAGAPSQWSVFCLLTPGGATIIVFPIQALRFRGRAGHISNSRPARQRGSQDGTHPESDRTEGEHTRARQQRGPHPQTGNFTLEAGSAACGRARVHRASTGARFDGRAPVPARRTCDQRRPQPPAGARSWGAASRASACGAPARCAPGLLHRHFNSWASGRAAPAWRARGAPQGPIPHTPDAIWGAAAGGPRPAGGRGWQGPPAVARSRRRRRSKFRPRRARERNLWQRQRVRRGAQRHHGSLAAAGLPGRRALEAGPTGRGALSRRRELARRRRRRMQRLARALALRAGARQRRRAGSLQQPLAREA